MVRGRGLGRVLLGVGRGRGLGSWVARRSLEVVDVFCYVLVLLLIVVFVEEGVEIDGGAPSGLFYIMMRR